MYISNRCTSQTLFLSFPNFYSRRQDGFEDDDNELDLGDDASTIKIEMQPMGNGDVLQRKSSHKLELCHQSSFGPMPVTPIGVPTPLTEEGSSFLDLDDDEDDNDEIVEGKEEADADSDSVRY